MNLVEFYETVTVSLSHGTGASDGLLHLHAGMAILIVARILIGRSLATAIPFWTVCAFAIANEGLDRINHGTWHWQDTLGDVAVTVFWPLVLTIGARVERARQAKRAARGRVR